MTRLDTIVAGGLLALTLVSCGKEEPPPPPPSRPAQTYTPPPPPPEPVNTDQLLQASGADARVQFPQKHAPTDESFARAVIALADALARGDETKMRGVLTQPAQGVLGELVGNAAWYDATDAIEAVRVVELDAGARTVTLAVQDPDGAYVLKWRGTLFAGSYAFEGVSSPTTERHRATDFDSGVPEVQDVSQSADIVNPIDPRYVYAFVELNKAIQREVGVPEAADEAVFQTYAARTGHPADLVRTSYESAGLYEDKTLDPPEFDSLVDTFVSITQTQSLSITRSRIAELLAEILGMSEPPAPADAEDDGGIIKRTPAGPVRIPTRDNRPPPP